MDGNLERWIELRDDDALAIRESTDPTPHSPPRLAWLGGSDALTEEETFFSEILQSVLIPAGTRQLKASCWYQIFTTEEELTVYDEVFFALFDHRSYESVALLGAITNLDETDVWTMHTQTIAAPELNGLQVWFGAVGNNDDSYPTDFYVDSCSLVATVCN
jgi:hypothetical protein